MAVAVVSGLVGETLVAPASADDFPNGKIAAVFGDDEVKREVEPSGGGLPVGASPRPRVLRERQDVGKNSRGHKPGAGPGRLGLDKLACAVQIYEPVLRSRSHGGTLIQRLAHDTVGGEPCERLDHRGAAHPEVFGEPGALQLAAGGKLAAHDAQENAVVRFVIKGAPVRNNNIFPEERVELRVTAGVERGKRHAKKLGLTEECSTIK